MVKGFNFQLLICYTYNEPSHATVSVFRKYWLEIISISVRLYKKNVCEYF